MTRHNQRLRKILLSLLTMALALIMIIPFLWMVSSSFKDSFTMFNFPIKWIPHPPHLGGYRKVFASEVPFSLLYLNSIKVTLLSMIGTLVSCSLAGYAYAKISFNGRNTLFIIKLATMMIPLQVTMLPTFIILRSLGLYDTHTALWLPFFFGQPLGVFLMRQYFLQLPNELSEAAIMDGGGHLYILTRVALPLCSSGVSVLMFLYFVASWNNYQGPLLFLYSTEKYTLPLAVKYFSDEFDTNYSAIMAAAVLTMLPLIVFFLFIQRYILDSYMGSALKE